MVMKNVIHLNLQTDKYGTPVYVWRGRNSYAGPVFFLLHWTKKVLSSVPAVCLWDRSIMGLE